MSDFRTFVAELVREYGTAQALADLIGMSLSAFSRGVRNEGTLSEANLLRLAEATGTDPTTVLRLAGKQDVAARLARLYGPPRPPLSDDDRALLALDRDVKQQVLHLVAGLSGRRSTR